MSRENVELVRRSFELWLRGDVEAWIETIDPDVGWDISAHPLPDVPNHGRGREALATDMPALHAVRQGACETGCGRRRSDSPGRFINHRSS